jgi:hypothetical protein
VSKREDALKALKKAREIIDVGENRAMAADAMVGHCREELSNLEFDEMWQHVERAINLLTSPSKRKSTMGFGTFARVKTP